MASCSVDENLAVAAGDHRLSAPQCPHGTSSWAAGSVSQRQLTAYHPHGTLIAQNDGPHSLAPGDDPVSGLGPITVAANVHIPGPYMQHTSGIRAEDRIVFEHSDSQEIRGWSWSGSLRCACPATRALRCPAIPLRAPRS